VQDLARTVLSPNVILSATFPDSSESNAHGLGKEFGLWGELLVQYFGFREKGFHRVLETLAENVDDPELKAALPMLSEMIGIQTGEALPHRLDIRPDTVRRLVVCLLGDTNNRRFGQNSVKQRDKEPKPTARYRRRLTSVLSLAEPMLILIDDMPTAGADETIDILNGLIKSKSGLLVVISSLPAQSGSKSNISHLIDACGGLRMKLAGFVPAETHQFVLAAMAQGSATASPDNDRSSLTTAITREQTNVLHELSRGIPVLLDRLCSIVIEKHISLLDEPARIKQMLSSSDTLSKALCHGLVPLESSSLKVAQCAAVCGKVFSVDALRAIGEEFIDQYGLEDDLAQLIASNIVTYTLSVSSSIRRATSVSASNLQSPSGQENGQDRSFPSSPRGSSPRLPSGQQSEGPSQLSTPRSRPVTRKGSLGRLDLLVVPSIVREESSGLADCLGSPQGASILHAAHQKLGSGGGSVETLMFRHTFVRQALLEMLSEDTRRMLHRRAANYYLSSDNSIAAYHFRMAGEVSSAIQFFELAAERFMQLCQYASARQCYHNLIKLDSNTRTAEPARKAWWYFQLAVAYQQSGFRIEARAQYLNSVRVFRHGIKLHPNALQLLWALLKCRFMRPRAISNVSEPPQPANGPSILAAAFAQLARILLETDRAEEGLVANLLAIEALPERNGLESDTELVIAYANMWVLAPYGQPAVANRYVSKALALADSLADEGYVSGPFVAPPAWSMYRAAPIRLVWPCRFESYKIACRLALVKLQLQACCWTELAESLTKVENLMSCSSDAARHQVWRPKPGPDPCLIVDSRALFTAR
jgi:tetratricopeptide (TPR) repeat protein